MNLFPTPIGIFELDRDITLQERSFLLDQPRRSNQLNERSVNSYLLNSPALADIKLFFEQSAKQYFTEIFDPATECSLKITQSWANYSEDRMGHHRHSHQNSIVSGVFYVQTSDSDKIRFYKPFSSYEQFQIFPKEFNYFTSTTWWLPAKQCSLILFPSKLEHGVDQDTRAETRISLSFNTFFSGVIGSEASLTELILP